MPRYRCRNRSARYLGRAFMLSPLKIVLFLTYVHASFSTRKSFLFTWDHSLSYTRIAENDTRLAPLLPF